MRELERTNTIVSCRVYLDLKSITINHMGWDHGIVQPCTSSQIHFTHATEFFLSPYYVSLSFIFHPLSFLALFALLSLSFCTFVHASCACSVLRPYFRDIPKRKRILKWTVQFFQFCTSFNGFVFSALIDMNQNK